MRIFFTIWLISFAFVSKGQVIDTLFYNDQWQLVQKGTGSYFRVAQINRELLQFVGKFTDYYASGQILLEGQYSSSGKKNGVFTRYYNNGTVYSRGAYDDDFFTGKWTYYYPNGTLKEEINFENGKFVVSEYIDPEGNHRVKNGTGKWQRKIQDGGVVYTLYTTFRDYRRSGNWTLRFPDGAILLKESYEYGKFIQGFQEGNPPTYYLETQFLDDIFYPETYFIIEAFSVWEATQQDYPYINWLSKLPFDSSLSSHSIDSLSSLDQQFEVPDRSASYPMGLKAFYRKISTLLKYPPEAQESGITGKVYVEFVIGLDGKIGSIRVLKGIGGGCDQEAILAILGAGKWFPAQKLGQPIEQKILIPITFQLQ